MASINTSENLGASVCPLETPEQPWHVSHLFRWKPPASSRRRGRTQPIELPSLIWSPGPLETLEGRRRGWPNLSQAEHRHTTFDLGTHKVHVDWIRGSGGGPGFSL